MAAFNLSVMAEDQDLGSGDGVFKNKKVLDSSMSQSLQTQL